MVVKRNTCTGGGGIPGVPVDIDNSAGGGNDPFDDVISPAADSVTFDIKDGVQSIRLHTPDGVTDGEVHWSITDPGGHISTIGGRVELYLPAPGVLDGPFGGGAAYRYVHLGTMGMTLLTLDRISAEVITPTGLVLFGPTAPAWIEDNGDVLPTDQWFRIEWIFQVNEDLHMEWEVHVYPTRSALVASHTYTGDSTWPGVLLSDTALIEFGGPSHSEYWMSGLEVNTTGLPGPSPESAAPLLSTLSDTFGSINTDKWAASGPASAVAGNLTLGVDAEPGVLTSLDTYRLDWAEVTIVAPGLGVRLEVIDVLSDDNLGIVVNADGWTVRAQHSVGGASYASEPVEFDLEEHRHLKISRNADDQVGFLVSGDGIEWATLNIQSVPAEAFQTVKAVLTGAQSAALDNFNVAVPAPVAPAEPGSGYPTPRTPGDGGYLPPFAPDATTPAIPTPGSALLIDVVRQFSSKVARAVRLTGPTSIEMVDPDIGLPTGWTQGDADALYHSTNRTVQAGANVLSLARGHVAVTAEAQLITNDVRLVESDWQLPNRLPVYGLEPAHVKRFTYVFTPDAFSAAVEFHVNPTPLIVRGA